MSEGQIALPSPEAATQRWGERVDELRREEQRAICSGLEIQWRKGQFLSELRSSSELYGGKTIEDLSQDLGYGNSVSTLRGCLAFYDKHDDLAEIRDLSSRSHSWNLMHRFLGLTRLQEAVILAKLDSGRLALRDVPAEVKKVQKQAETHAKKNPEAPKPERRGGAGYTTRVRMVLDSIESAASKLEDFSSLLQEVERADLSEDQTSTLDMKTAEVYKRLNALGAKITRVLRRARS